nr:MAG TPA: hypothetical protein [Bacteriophage sp.]
METIHSHAERNCTHLVEGNKCESRAVAGYHGS